MFKLKIHNLEITFQSVKVWTVLLPLSIKTFSEVLLADKDKLSHLDGSAHEIGDITLSTSLQPYCLTITKKVSGLWVHVNTKEVVAGDKVADQILNEWKRSMQSSFELGVHLL
jgi:hypothetical protein